MTEPVSQPVHYSCGCVNRVDAVSGVLRSQTKCSQHQPRDPSTLDRAYYEGLGTARDSSPHVGELTEALGSLPAGSGTALEIGCGASPYVQAIRAAGWEYLGLDPSPWAAEWLAGVHHAKCVTSSFGMLPDRFGLILAAHSLEHLSDAPDAIGRCSDLMVCGGELWIVVPDDSDPVNPDHFWFFTAATLRACVERAGLLIVREATRSYVAKEQFLYLRARKP